MHYRLNRACIRPLISPEKFVGSNLFSIFAPYSYMKTMKKHVTLTALLLATALSANAQKALVAIIDQPVKGEYQTVKPGIYPISQSKGGDYIIGIGQETERVPKTGCHTEVWTAQDGHGYLTVATKAKNGVAVYQSMAANAPVVAKLPANREDDIPESYACLGKTGKWYKISVDGKTGYVKACGVTWHISEADCGGCIR